jgi:hypothetical protein
MGNSHVSQSPLELRDVAAALQGRWGLVGLKKIHCTFSQRSRQGSFVMHLPTFLKIFRLGPEEGSRLFELFETRPSIRELSGSRGSRGLESGSSGSGSSGSLSRSGLSRSGSSSSGSSGGRQGSGKQEARKCSALIVFSALALLSSAGAEAKARFLFQMHVFSGEGTNCVHRDELTILLCNVFHCLTALDRHGTEFAGACSYRVMGTALHPGSSPALLVAWNDCVCVCVRVCVWGGGGSRVVPRRRVCCVVGSVCS